MVRGEPVPPLSKQLVSKLRGRLVAAADKQVPWGGRRRVAEVVICGEAGLERKKVCYQRLPLWPEGGIAAERRTGERHQSFGHLLKHLPVRWIQQISRNGLCEPVNNGTVHTSLGQSEAANLPDAAPQ